MQKISFGSPAKENQNCLERSPNKKRKGEAISQILKYLKNLNISLPSHVQKLLAQSHSESPLKQASMNAKQEIDSKKLRVQLSECQFELKKMEQDFAEFKRNIKMQKQKQAKKNEEILAKLKYEIQNLNEDGSYLLDKQKKQFQLQMKTLKQKNKLELEQQLKVVNQNYKVKLQNQQKLSRRQVHELHRTYDNKMKETTNKYEEEIYKLKVGLEQEVKQLAMKHKYILEDKERKSESIRLALESQRKTEEKLHEKTKLQASKQKEKLIFQLCYGNNIKKQLQEQIQSNKKQTKRLKSLINDLQITLQLKEQKYKRKYEQFQRDMNEKYRNYEQMQKETMTSINLVHVEELQSIQKRLKEMEKIRNEKEDLLARNTEELSNFFEKRPSKKQDLSEIEKLKWALTRRQEEVRKLSRDVKNCNLELENKEDIYTRMFRGSSLNRQKKYTTKDDKEKQQLIIDEKLGKDTIFRKSHTADLKFLLKVYSNKNNRLE